MASRRRDLDHADSSADRCFRSAFLTRPVGLVVLLFLLVANVEHWRVGKNISDTARPRSTLMWTIAAFYVVVHGGGLYSVDHLFGWEF